MKQNFVRASLIYNISRKLTQYVFLDNHRRNDVLSFLIRFKPKTAQFNASVLDLSHAEQT